MGLIIGEEGVRWDVALTKDGNRVWIDDDCDEAFIPSSVERASKIS